LVGNHEGREVIEYANTRFLDAAIKAKQAYQRAKHPSAVIVKYQKLIEYLDSLEVCRWWKCFFLRLVSCYVFYFFVQSPSKK
jgi:hypothetical protein